MVAQEPLELYVQVRILAPQLDFWDRVQASRNVLKGTSMQRIRSDSHEMGQTR